MVATGEPAAIDLGLPDPIDAEPDTRSRPQPVDDTLITLLARTPSLAVDHPALHGPTMTGTDVLPMFTVRQGEDLAFIHSHATKVGVSPSFEAIARHYDGVRHRRSVARR